MVGREKSVTVREVTIFSTDRKISRAPGISFLYRQARNRFFLSSSSNSICGGDGNAFLNESIKIDQGSPYSAAPLTSDNRIEIGYGGYPRTSSFTPVASLYRIVSTRKPVAYTIRVIMISGPVGAYSVT